MSFRIVVIGYGDAGRSAVGALKDDAEVVVLDVDESRAALAVADGAAWVHGNGRDASALRHADVPDADTVIVTVPDGPATVQITRQVRALNRHAMIVTVVREGKWRAPVLRSGADQVLVTDMLAGHVLGMTVCRPESAARLFGPTRESPELAIAARAVRASEIGRAPADLGPRVVAVLRDGARFWLDHPSLGTVRASDQLLTLGMAPIGE